MNIFKSPVDLDIISDIVVFSDVDDCLLLSERKSRKEVKLYEAGYDRSGKPISFFDPGHVALVRALFNAGIVIPVTGRNSEALKRTNINFHGYRAVSHGGLVLKDADTIDGDWLDYRYKEIKEYGEYIEHLNEFICRIIKDENLSLRVSIVKDFDLPMYISIKNNALLENEIEILKDIISLAPDESSQYKHYVHHNGRNMALLPPHVSKHEAVKFIKNKLQTENLPKLFIGVGDSHSDLDFMSECDYSICPNNSQIAEGIYL